MGANEAILVASFGTSHPDTCRRNIAAIERDIAAAYPGWEVRRAFTSGMIIRKLRERDRVAVDTVAQALQRLADDGFSRVVLQPTHIVNGGEFDKIVRDSHPFLERLAISVGAPLLSAAADYRALAQVLSGQYPARPGSAVCLMGHGTAHFADSAYAALAYHFRLIGRPDIVVGTVEGFPDLAAARGELQSLAPKRVQLVPLMVVAGDHALGDMAGEGAHSWRSVLRADGYAVECVLGGLGELPGVRALYLAHVEAAMQTV